MSHPDNSDLNNRLRFLGLDDKGRETLKRLGPLIHKHIGGALDIFYDKVRKVPETAAFFRNDDHMKGAKKRQEEHWGIVGTAEYTHSYVEGVTKVGKAHARIGLEPRWYIGGYALVLEQLVHAVARERWPSRFGSTCWSLVSARSALSSIPLTAPPLAVRRETATATASSSSRRSGGMAVPATSR